MATPSLAMIPSGKKEGVLYSAIPNTSVGDFTVERGSNATFVNSDGLIQSTNVIGGELVSNGNFSEEGSEEITNGDFSNGSTDWNITNNVGSSTNISGGTLNIVTDGAFTQALQNNVVTVGKFYLLKYTVLSSDNGVLGIEIGGSTVVIPSTVGEHQYYFTSNTTSLTFKRKSGVLNISIDNVSIKEVGQNWTALGGWSIGDDKAICDGTSIIYTNASMQASKSYKITYTVSDYVSGGVKALINGTPDVSGATRTANGTYTEQLMSSSSVVGNFSLSAVGSFNGSVTNISVVEVTEATNTPRIDYTDGGCPVLLTEPQRTNEVSHSSDFSDASWVKQTGITITSNNSISPDGTQNASRAFFNSNNLQLRYIITTVGDTVSSLYIKGVNGETIGFGVGGAESLVTLNGEWQRFEQYKSSNIEKITINTFNGATARDIEIYGAQLEQGSYATSLIPTYGSPYTRLGEVVRDAGDASTFNSTEGVLFAEIQGLVDGVANRFITLGDGTSANSIGLYFNLVSGRVSVEVRSSGSSNSYMNYSPVTQTDMNKIAVLYKDNDYQLWINGVEVASNTNAMAPLALSKLSLNPQTSVSQGFYGKTSQIQVFNTALTDAELADLTYPVTYDSFNEMANALNLTII